MELVLIALRWVDSTLMGLDGARMTTGTSERKGRPWILETMATTRSEDLFETSFRE